MKIKIKPINENSILPTHSHPFDAGWDCYAQSDGEGLKGLGFAIEIPNGYVGLILPRSSMNLKGAYSALGVIDAGYTGEVKAIIKNADIKKGDKICQLVIVATPIPELVVCLENDRLNNGFGSTGR